MQNSTEGFRLSPQQKNLWSLQQTNSGQPFHAVCTIELTGNLNRHILKAALGDVVRRHEILRTTFQRPRGIRTPFQVVAETLEPSWQTIDISSLNAEEQNTRIRDDFVAASTQSFDFEQGPLLRVTLLKLSATRHLLTVSLPALCADSQTLANLVRELIHAYESLTGGTESGEPMQYADFAEWQNELIEAKDELALEGRQYWQKQQEVRTATLKLEKESAQPDVSRVFAAAAVSFALDSELLEKIQGLALAHEASVWSVLFTCWEALVCRLSGYSDFVLFATADGRKFDDLKDALGLYARYVPIRCSGEDVELTELLRATHSARNAANEWQEYFDPSIASFSPHDGIVFDFQERLDFAAAGLQVSILKQDVCLSPFKLKLSFVRSGDVLSGELQYDPQRFELETIERIAGYFQKLSQTLVCDSAAQGRGSVKQRSQPEGAATTIGAVDILSAEERWRLLIGNNQTTVAFSAGKCIHELFEAQVVRTPEAIALFFGDRELTYRDLNGRANRLAHLLRRRGLAPNDRVGLCTERGVEMIVGLLGILKAGGAYVPLNPEHPKERLALQLAESKALLLVTAAGAIDSSLQFAGETIDLTLDEGLLTNEPETDPASVVSPENLVYVIYTSGSTGVPKGVAITHGNLVNYTQFILRRLKVTSPLNFASVSTISADLGNTCIFPSLVSGGCLHLLSYEVAMSGVLFRDYVLKRPIEVLKIVPSHLNALLSADMKGEFLPSKYLICGGEALSWEMVQRIAQLNPACQIINHYGPTETTVGSLTYDVDTEDARPWSQTVPVGRPIANTRLFVLDKYFQPAPTGVAGELFVGGAGVAVGYLNLPGETAERFMADPFATEPGARLYRTGDLARYLPDSNLEFLGRVDYQVKVRGFRVELGEIEAVLASHPKVRQVVVVALNAGIESAVPSADQRLVAYLISSTAKPSTTDDLRNLLKQKLPDYMAPSAFVFLKSMPLTANGKIDRAALPAPDDTRPDLKKTFLAPRTPVEAELARIWASLLKVSEVGVHDNFFDLGGHSLLATQVVSRMRQTFQVEISLRSLFESPTVAALAEQIDQASSDETARLLAELEELSEEEAELLLEQEQSQSSDA